MLWATEKRYPNGAKPQRNDTIRRFHNKRERIHKPIISRVGAVIRFAYKELFL